AELRHPVSNLRTSSTERPQRAYHFCASRGSELAAAAKFAKFALRCQSMRKPVLVLLSFLFLATTANAQYFGRNKVQWEHFDFKVLKTEHFDIYYYDREADVV